MTVTVREVLLTITEIFSAIRIAFSDGDFPSFYFMIYQKGVLIMKKFAFIGGGSFGFTRTLVKDLLTFPAFADAEIALMDIDEERLDYIKRACEKIVRAGNYPAKGILTCKPEFK